MALRQESINNNFMTISKLTLSRCIKRIPDGHLDQCGGFATLVCPTLYCGEFFTRIFYFMIFTTTHFGIFEKLRLFRNFPTCQWSSQHNFEGSFETNVLCFFFPKKFSNLEGPRRFLKRKDLGGGEDIPSLKSKTKEARTMKLSIVIIYYIVKSRTNGQTLFGKHLKICLSNTMFVGSPLRKHVLDKHVLLGTYKKMFLKVSNKMFLSSNACRGGQTHKHS